MKSKLPHPFFAVWLALALLPVLPALAEPAEPKQETPPATATPAADKSVDADKPAQAVASPEGEKPAAEKTAAEATTDDKTVAPESTDKKTAEPEQPAKTEKKAKHLRTIGVGPHRSHNSGNERVSFGQDSTLAAGEQADAVVSIFGSSTSAGEVGDAIVSVIGNTRVTGGSVGDAAVAVLGSTYVNGHVHGEVVTVLGNVELGPDAIVDGEIVCIGGEVKRDAKAVVHGDVQHIAVGGRYFNFDGLSAWFTQCLLYGRPLAFGPHLMWAWWIALACLGFYAVVALVAPDPVLKCVQTLEERPGKSILSGVLTLLLTPVAYVLLALTIFIVVGVVLIPLFSMGLFFAVLFGKVVMLTWLGRRITKLFGDGPLAQPVFGVLIGGVIVLGLYTVPVVGFIVYKLLGMLGLGVVIYTLLLTSRSNRAAAAAARASLPPTMDEGAGTGAAPVTPVASLPSVISAATLPRAGFWLRIAASVLDAVMVGIVFGMLHRLWYGFGGVYPFWYALYCVVMWATKGTTIGGIVCGLKVVRLDDRPLDWGVALVRCLSAFLSLCVAGLGFIWVAFDDEKQSWHDKIAGTTIVRVPKGTPLL